ncbi:MAG: UDP-N-acetylmuramoyl-L-alanine--D-glutamate ligase [Nitriliruptoraceae bacterium]
MTAAEADRIDVARVRRVLVVGVGASARGAVRLAMAHDVEVVVVDRDESHAGADAMRDLGPSVRVDPDVDPATLAVDLVVPSPGVPEHDPLLHRAEVAGLPIWSEPQFALALRPRTVLGVTGTNGKTSTTELLAAILEEGGRPVVACGNIGLTVSDAVLEHDASTLFVVEFSSFQLRFAGLIRCRVGVVLNLAADHLDWHRDLDAYAEAKARIWEAQVEGDWAVANDDDPATVALRDRRAPAGHASFSARRGVQRGVGVVDGHLVCTVDGEARAVIATAELAASAEHHVANLCAAATAARLVGADADAIARVARRWQPGEHRGRVVAVAGGVRWVDDSKATNPHATVAALASADPIVWIAGGIAKGVDLGALGPHLTSVRHALLIGTSARALADVCAAHGVPATIVDGLGDAVRTAAGIARPGDTVLLAPACASFDQFRDYRHRGEVFVAAVTAIVAGDAHEVHA